MKKNLLLFILFGCLAFSMFSIISLNNPRSVATDSGWDSSYDRGGSSSSHGSSHSSDHGSSHSSSSSDSYSSGSSRTSSVNLDKYDKYELAIKYIFILAICGFLVLYFVIRFYLSSGIKKFLSDMLHLIGVFVFIGLILFVEVLLIKNDLFILAIIFFITFPYIAVILIHLIGRVKDNYERQKSFKNNFLSAEEVKKLDSSINMDSFMNDVFELYKDIQSGWMNFEYDKLKPLLSDELYNQYKMQLEALSLKNQQNVMHGFEYKDGGIVSIKFEGDIETVIVKLNVKMYDYVINRVNNRVLRGKKFKKIDIMYRITLERSVGKVMNICPQCGAKVKEGSNVCKYCNSPIVRYGRKFVMTKKENIFQR